MDRSKKVALPGSVAIAALVAYGWHAGWWSLLSIADATLDALIAGIVGLLLWAFHSEIQRTFRRGLGPRESKRPDLRVAPLKHLRGWMQPTDRPEDFIVYEGETPTLGADPKWGRATHPERIGHGIHLAQVLELVWPDPKVHPNRQLNVAAGQTQGTLTLKFQASKFGVLSVTNLGDEAEHCVAHGYYQIEGSSREFDVGNLNWYSRPKRMALKHDDKELEALSRNVARTHTDALVWCPRQFYV